MFCFVKHKTAYEMRISDWSSDVCSSDLIEDGMEVTVSCAEGDTGFIYAGTLPFERITTDLSHMPEAPLKIMMHVANPERAFDFGQLPNARIGLARLEMIIAAHPRVHPKTGRAAGRERVWRVRKMSGVP